MRNNPACVSSLSSLLGLAIMISSLVFSAYIVPIALAQRTEPLPDELEGVGITEHLSAPLPLDAEFVNADGQAVKLGDYFDGTRPVILNLGYYGCPMLCGLITNGLTEGMKGLKWTPGQEYEVIILSFDPTETHTLAKAKKQNYIKQLGRPSAARGWHFLTGTELNIKQVTEAVGFGYRWNERLGQFSHAAAIFICTPAGKISRYIYGIEFDPQTLRLSLVEAAAGKVGSSFDKFLLFCFHYDAEAGRYAPAARNLMRAGGFTTVLFLGTALAIFWRRESRRRRQPADS